MTQLWTVGIVGVGQVGLPISRNVMQAGYRAVGFGKPVPDEFRQQGGEVVSSVAELVSRADTVLLCLPNEAAEREVFEGPVGLLQALKPGQVVVELGTYKREFKEAQAKRIEAHGGHMLEAEISGSPPMIVERRAALFLGGTPELIAQCKPVLDAITGIHFHIGPFGSAVAMKLVANYLVAVHTLAAAEAMNLGMRAGFTGEQVIEVIGKSAGSSTMFTIRAPFMASRKFVPAPGPVATLEKYLDMAGELAASLGCATPLFSAAAPYFRRASNLGMRQEDISAVIKLIEADSRAVS